jgi:hypothetical protein
MNTPTRFVVRWDDTTSQYRVSKPGIDYMEVVSAQDYDHATQTIAQLTDELNRLRLEHKETMRLFPQLMEAIDQLCPDWRERFITQEMLETLVLAEGIAKSQKTPPAAS